MPSTRPTPDEVDDLRRCVRDLVAVSTLPAVWENADALGIGRGLAEVLLRILAPDFLYVRLHGRDGGPPLEALRTRQRAETEARAHEVGKWLERWLRFEDADAPPTIPNPLGDGMVRLAVFPIGHGHDHGLLAAGCGRANFPTDTERLLLGVAVNQAAGLLQRKEAEEQLRRSEQELADFFENAAVGLHWAGPDGMILRVNQAELDLLGYNREEYLGRHIAEFHADRDVIEDILRRLSAGETLRDYEARMRCKDGSHKHVLINSNVLWEGGRFVHTRCFTRDITDRRLAEELLRKQSEWLRVTLASIGDAVITTDTAGRITSLNPVAETLTGWPQEEATGQPLGTVFRIVNEQSRQGVENPATRALREGQIVGLANHTVLIARDGTERAIDDSAAPIKDGQGDVIGVVLIFRDVSEKRRADRALAESEARKAAVLRTALDCIITCDEQGRVLEFNPAAERTFGRKAAEVIGRDMADLIIPPSMRDRHRNGMARYLATGEAKLLNRRIEMTARRADGTDFPAELAITRIPAPGPPQFTAYLRDITERKSLERRRNARLAVTQVLAQADTLKEAAPRILQAVCESLGWDMGTFWMVDKPANVLRCQEVWHTASVRARAFTECCRQQTFDPGIGLPGRVWSSGRPAWIPDVAQDANFPRAAIAVQEGLHGAFGAPISSGQELLGGVEFFSREIREPDSDLLEMMATIGGQIGLFIDRKRAEQERDRFFTVGTDLLVVAGFDGYFKRVNPAWEKVLGWSAEQLTSQPWLHFVHPDDRAATEAEAGRLFQGLETVSFENRYRSKSGEYRWLSWRVKPYPEERLLYGGASDITERKRSERALRESEEKLRLMADTIPQLAWMAQPDGYIFWYNRRWYEYTGTTPEQMEGWGWQSVHDPEMLPKVLERWKKSIGTGEPFDMVFPLKGADGQFRPFLTRVNPLRDQEGRILYWFGTNTDISEQKRAEDTSRFLADASATLAELTDYESTLQRVASLAVPHFADWCAVDMQDVDGTVRRLAVTHSDPAKVRLAHELFQRYPPLPTDPHGVMAVLRTGEPEWSAAIPDSLLVGLAQDDEHLRIIRDLGLKSYLCVPLRSRTKILGVLTFVTAESGRAYDADYLRAAEDLADRAAIAIENASLLAALKETDRRKDEFLAMLAHELRNPLAPIRNAVQIFRAKGPPVPELQWARDVIERQVQQMTRLVDDLLDVSRITRGKIELRKERVELATVVNSAVEASRPLIEKWGHELTVKLPPEPVYLEADQTRLAQALLNLLNNAANYTEQGGRIWLTAERDGESVVIRVEDTGIGIPPEMLPRIFEMFTQVDRSLERSQGGLGIGLTLVQSLVEMHGGTVKAHSDGPGKGSEFVVQLPVAAEIKDRGRDGAAGGERVAAPAKCRILVVDDNQDAADSLAMLLRILGNEVHTAHDGLEAVGAAGVFRPDVVLLDIGLPKLNGYEAGRRIREQQGNGVVLIALTGWGQEEDRRRSKEAGFDHHMTKPVEFDALQTLLAGLKAAAS